MNLKNRKILITGANRGIGEALVNEALRRGARKVYAGTRTTLRHTDDRVTPLTLDVTSDAQIERAAREIDALDVLVNNAGIALPDDSASLAPWSNSWPSTSSGPSRCRALSCHS